MLPRAPLTKFPSVILPKKNLDVFTSKLELKSLSESIVLNFRKLSPSPVTPSCISIPAPV